MGVANGSVGVAWTNDYLRRGWREVRGKISELDKSNSYRS